MPEFQPRLEILPEAQRQLWPLLAPVSEMGFVLYGGTALALQIGHRVSVDFDFFTDRTFENSIIASSFSFLENAETVQNDKNTLTVLTSRLVKISFFGAINFGRVGEPLTPSDTNIHVASLDDLMATKLKVLFDRVECKDYRDLAAMIRHGVDLPKGLAAARTMFGGNFQPAEALKAMTYFEGGDLAELDMADRQVLVSAARQLRELPDVHIMSHGLSVEPPAQNESSKKRQRMR